MREILLIMDDKDCLLKFNRSAQTYFGFSGVSLGRPAELLFGSEFFEILRLTMERVRVTAVAERLEASLADQADRQVSLAVIPLGKFIALAGHDTSLTAQLVDAQAALNAVDQALTQLDGVAKVRINLRGYVLRATESLARLTGLSQTALETVKFANLFSIDTRVSVSETLEHVIDKNVPQNLDCELLLGGTRTQRVRLGLSPFKTSGRIEAVQAILMQTAT